MNFANPLLILGLAALPLSASALDDGQAAAQPQDEMSASALVKKLGDKDYKARKEAFRALEKMGAQAREELEKALKNDDPEVRWSASLLLDRLEDSDQPGEPGSTRGRLRARAGSGDPADADDPQLSPFAPGLRGVRPFALPDDAMQEMQEAIRRLEEFQKQIESQNPGWFRGSPFGLRMQDDPFDGFGRFFGQGGKLELAPGGSFSRTTDNNGQRESVSIQVDQDGHVKAQLERNGEKSSYEADSLDALQKEHPELFEGFGGMSVQRLPFPRGARDPLVDPNAVQPPRLQRRRALEQPSAPKPETSPKAGANQVELAPDRPRLGVQVQPVSAAVAEYLDLEAGLGLEVIEVVSGTAAEQIGVKPRDIITEINGQEIRGVADVAKALGRKDPADAEVTVLRRGAEKTLEPKKK